MVLGGYGISMLCPVFTFTCVRVHILQESIHAQGTQGLP